MKVKIFRIRKDKNGYYYREWQFNCFKRGCHNCHSRFKCYTESDTVVIVDKDMWNELGEWEQTSQSRARKKFFEVLW